MEVTRCRMQGTRLGLDHVLVLEFEIKGLIA